MRATAALLVILAAASPAAAADAPASLACTGKARKDVTLKGLIPATASELDLTLRAGDAMLAMTDQAGDRVHVVEAFVDRVFTIAVTRKDGRKLLLYALPRSLQVKRDEQAVHARFEGVLLEAPPLGAGPGLRGVKMSCQYDYET